MTARKILIIVGGLQLGGAERFAVNIAKYAPKEEFEFDYLMFDGLGDALVPEVEAAGARVITIPSPNKGYGQYIKTLGNLITKEKYCAVHSQTQFNSGINMWVAKNHGVPIRIAHSHTTAHEDRVSFKQLLYEQLMRILIRQCSTDMCACGVEAGKWMYGKHPFTIINNGIDTEAFKFSHINRDKIRLKYGLGRDSFVIGHSGTLSKLKNQETLIRILPDNMYLMLVGRGNEQYTTYLTELAKQLGKRDRVIFTGGVNNVNEHLSAFDVFAFPSLREGTPLALIEAQANGLPCIISDVIPEDAVITDIVKSVSLTSSDDWALSIASAKRNNPEVYADIVNNAGYGVESSMRPLYDIYRG